MSELPFKAPIGQRIGFSRFHGYSSRHTEEVNQKFGISAFYAASREDNEIRRISEVESGLACNCYCLACEENLVAKKGDIKAHHFSHQANSQCSSKTNQEYNREIIKLIAKKAVSKAEKIRMPNYKFTRTELFGNTRTISNTGNDENSLLDHTSKIIVDGKELPILISFKIDKRVSGKVLDTISESGLVSAMEIDLEPFLQRCNFGFDEEPPFEKMVDYIVSGAPRKWIMLSAEMARTLWPEFDTRHPPSFEDNHPFFMCQCMAQAGSMNRWHTMKGEHSTDRVYPNSTIIILRKDQPPIEIPPPSI